MNNLPTSLALTAASWPELDRQVRQALSEYWHQHAGQWQPESISLQVATRLLPDAVHGAQRAAQLPVLLAWLRLQCRVITVHGDRSLTRHRLCLNRPPARPDRC